MSDDRLQGIVLHRASGTTSSRIIEVLTAQRGRLRLRAPAAANSRRRFGGSLDVFAQLHLFVHPQVRAGNLPTLTHVEAIDARWALRQQLPALAMAAVCCQAVRRLVPEAMAVPAIYHALNAALQEAQAGRWPQASVFLVGLAAQLGTPLRPSCCLCQRQPRTMTDVGWGWLDAGSIACSACRDGLRPLPAAVLRALLGQPPQQACEAIVVTQTMLTWLAHHSGLPPQALQTSLWPPPSGI